MHYKPGFLISPSALEVTETKAFEGISPDGERLNAGKANTKTKYSSLGARP
jgi:hypothetical protein